MDDQPTETPRHGGGPRGSRGRAGSPARGAATAVTAALLLIASSGAAGAQEAGGDASPGPEAGHAKFLVEAGPGLLAPLADLAPTEAEEPGTEPRPAPSLSVAASASAGAVYLLSPEVGVGLHGVWSRPDVDLGRVAGDAPGDGSRRLGTADFVAAVGEIVFRPLAAPGRSALDPYLAAGVGLRHLAFSDPDLEDSTDPLGSIGGGVRTTLSGPFFWTLEVRGFFSSTDPTSRGSRFQNDVLVTVGIGARL